MNNVKIEFRPEIEQIDNLFINEEMQRIYLGPFYKENMVLPMITGSVPAIAMEFCGLFPSLQSQTSKNIRNSIISKNRVMQLLLAGSVSFFILFYV